MRISHEALQGALQEKSSSAAQVIDMVRDKLRAGERVIVIHDDGQEELLEDDGKGGFKTTPIAKKK
jgi:hypothetical protein